MLKFISEERTIREVNEDGFGFEAAIDDECPGHVGVQFSWIKESMETAEVEVLETIGILMSARAAARVSSLLMEVSFLAAPCSLEESEDPTIEEKDNT